MLFNGPIWDLNFADFKKIDGAALLICDDETVTRLIKQDSFPHHKSVDGKDLDIGWFESTFQNLSLFASDENYFINNADKMNAATKKWVSENFADGTDKSLVFHLKKKVAFKIGTLEAKNVVQVKATPFWEYDKLLSFLAQKLELVLTPRGRQIILKRIENTSTALLNTLNILKVNIDSNNISEEDILKEVPVAYLDNFEISDYFNQRKMLPLFGRLIDPNLTRDDYLQLSMFMIGHIQKVIDPTYMTAKKKLSQYDRAIDRASKSWSREQLLSSLALFQTIEKKSKFNDSPREFIMQYQVKMLTP